MRPGVTCLWLMPFLPTPNRDDGYDISDFSTVDPRLRGVHADGAGPRPACHRGLVVNDASNRHPWFLDSRSGRDSRYRDWPR